MFVQLFSKYLIDENILSESNLDDLMCELKKTHVRLGTIAVEKKYLTLDQAERINRLQQEKDKKFGEIAEEEGLLSREQIQQLLSEQGSAYMQIGQLLRDRGILDFQGWNDAVKGFQKKFGFADDELLALLDDDIDKIVPLYVTTSKPYVVDLATLALRSITRFVSSDFYIGRAKRVDSFTYRSLAVQFVDGDADIKLGIATSENNDGFLKIASGFMKEEFKTLNYDVYDAVGEFVNCINGLFATNCSKNGIQLEIYPQAEYENQIANGEAYVLPIYISGQEVFLYISVNASVDVGHMKVLKKIRSNSDLVDDFENKRIVIVDDSTMSRKILRDLFEEAGLKVVAEAADGIEGVLAYKQYGPDLITLDITMPNMDGVHALKEIKNYDRDAKAIMITAAGQEKMVIDALKNGADKFITKPFDKDEVLKTVKELVNAD